MQTRLSEQVVEPSWESVLSEHHTSSQASQLYLNHCLRASPWLPASSPQTGTVRTKSVSNCKSHPSTATVEDPRHKRPAINDMWKMVSWCGGCCQCGREVAHRTAYASIYAWLCRGGQQVQCTQTNRRNMSSGTSRTCPTLEFALALQWQLYLLFSFLDANHSDSLRDITSIPGYGFSAHCLGNIGQDTECPETCLHLQPVRLLALSFNIKEASLSASDLVHALQHTICRSPALCLFRWTKLNFWCPSNLPHAPLHLYRCVSRLEQPKPLQVLHTTF